MPPLLQMKGIVKSFDSHRVLHGVDFDLHASEVHILAGENGAGKSTLMKILGGVHHPDQGEIRIRDNPVRFRSPKEATARGVAIIHQELSLVPSLSVADNMFLGRERSRFAWMQYGRQHSQCMEVLARLGIRIDPRTSADELPVSLQQMVEIAKSLARKADILVMDEPTSALNEPEVERLFDCIADLKAQGCGIVYITHKLEEVYRIADRITVLRDGNRIASDTASAMPARLLIRHMVGRDIQQEEDAAPPRHPSQTPVKLRLNNVSVRTPSGSRRPVVDRISIDVHAGEIVGLAGLQGSGNSDLLLGLFGAYGRRTSGEVTLEGKPYKPSSPRHAIRRGLALVTNDRKRTGLITGMSVVENTTLACLPRVSPWGLMRHRREFRLAADSTSAMKLRAASLRQQVSTLSGGNQQKVVLAKWLNTNPRVILLDEPTRGVDVGARQEIYQLMYALRDKGHAIVLITSEMPELLKMSDRIVVMHRGSGVALMNREQATQEKILHAAMGGTDQYE